MLIINPVNLACLYVEHVRWLWWLPQFSNKFKLKKLKTNLKLKAILFLFYFKNTNVTHQQVMSPINSQDYTELVTPSSDEACLTTSLKN